MISDTFAVMRYGVVEASYYKIIEVATAQGYLFVRAFIIETIKKVNEGGQKDED